MVQKEIIKAVQRKGIIKVTRSLSSLETKSDLGRKGIIRVMHQKGIIEDIQKNNI